MKSIKQIQCFQTQSLNKKIPKCIPALCYLLLFLPVGRSEKKPETAAEQTPEPLIETAESVPAPAVVAAESEPTETAGNAPRWRAFLQKALHKAWQKCCVFAARLPGFYRRSRTALITAGIALIALLVGLRVRRALVTVTAPRTDWHLPILVLAFFLFYIVLDRWCKYAPDAKGHEREGAALARNVRGALAVARVGTLLTAATLVVKLLGFYNATKALRVVLAVLIVYEAVFIFASLTVRLIRRELAVNPDLSVPMPGLGGGDYGVTAYLEENTGLSMRSLWSIRLMKKIAPYALIATLAVIWLCTGLVQVEAHQEAAVYRFGRLTDKTLEPGLHVTLPQPLDRVEIYDTGTVQKMTVGYTDAGSEDNVWTKKHGGEEYKLLLGGGKELVCINLRIEYRIDDLHDYLTGCAAPESLLSAAAYETVTARTINTDLDTLLAADRAAFADSFREELIARIEGHHTGLAIVSVVLESIHPPVEVAAAYQQLVAAGIKCDELILNAEAYAGETVAWAETTKDSTVNGARAAGYTDVAAATSAVAEFMAGVTADSVHSDEYRYYKYLTAMQKAYGGARLVIVGDGIDSGNIYLGSPVTVVGGE